MANEMALNGDTLDQFNQAVAQLVNVSKTINQLAKSQDENKTDIKNLSARMDNFETTLTISNTQACNIQKHVKAHVHKILGKSISKDYITYSRTFFGHLWSDLKDRFGVTSYHDIRNVDYNLALEFIEDWSPRDGVQALKDEVDIKNKGGEES